MPAGLGWGIAQHRRFAVAEVAAPDARSRAISPVTADGVLAVIIGPELVKRTNMLIPPRAFLGTYACLTVLSVIAAILLPFIHVLPAVRVPARRCQFAPSWADRISSLPSRAAWSASA